VSKKATAAAAAVKDIPIPTQQPEPNPEAESAQEVQKLPPGLDINELVRIQSELVKQIQQQKTQQLQASSSKAPRYDPEHPTWIIERNEEEIQEALQLLDSKNKKQFALETHDKRHLLKRKLGTSYVPPTLEEDIQKKIQYILNDTARELKRIGMNACSRIRELQNSSIDSLF